MAGYWDDFVRPSEFFAEFLNEFVGFLEETQLRLFVDTYGNMICLQMRTGFSASPRGEGISFRVC